MTMMIYNYIFQVNNIAIDVFEWEIIFTII